MNAPVFFESAGDERGTPQDFFDRLNAEFHFDLDCAASSKNHKCELYFGEGGMAFNALEEDWGGPGSSCFLNPPYSVAGAFVAKAREEADKGARVVMLLPVRSDTKYWHKYVWDKDALDSEQEQIKREMGAGEISLEHAPMIAVPNGNWRPGVQVRLIPGRLNFELTVPADIRTYIKSELSAGTEIAALVKTTGLPKMAIERIMDDQPDDCLLDAAPFPSCVVIFTGANL